MGFEDNSIKTKGNEVVTVTQVTPDMLSGLLTKVKQLDETGIFEVDYNSLNKLENFKTYISYFTSLKKLAELREHSKGKKKSSHLIHLENFKRGLMFLLRIPDNKFIIGHNQLRSLGRYLKKTNKDGSSELQDIVKAWGKYSPILDEAVRIIDKKHDGFIDFFKNMRGFKVFLFNYLLDNEKNIEEIIDTLRLSNETYITNQNNFFLISDTKEENSTILKDEEIPVYVLAFFLETSKREKIEELDISNAQKEALEQINNENAIKEKTDEIKEPEIYNNLPEKTDFFDDDVETSIERPTNNSLDDYLDDDQVEIPVINNNKPGIFVTVVNTDDDFSEEIGRTIKQWERLGIDTSSMKRDLVLTFLAYVKKLSNDLNDDDKEKVNAFI